MHDLLNVWSNLALVSGLFIVVLGIAAIATLVASDPDINAGR